MSRYHRGNAVLICITVALGLPLCVTPIEYCLMETFNATCRQPDELVVINDARYGRMSIGRCVTGSYGQLGCSVDVRRVLDSKCSGRRSCRVTIPDSELFATRPCPGDFTAYLDANYRCQRVEFGDRSSCQRHRALRIKTGSDGRPTSGFLASATTDEYGFGSGDCPWIIEAFPGQRVNVTLLSYTSTSSSSTLPIALSASAETAMDGPEHGHRGAPSAPDHTQFHRRRLEVCFEVAVVSDVSDRRVVSVCGASSSVGADTLDHQLLRPNTGETTVMLSRGNEVRVEIINRHMLRSIGAFMFQYKVFGCRSLRNNGEHWYRREGETMVVGCNSTTDTWFLVCKDTRWLGEVGNCTTTSTAISGILLVVCVGVAMGIIVGGLLLCVVTVFSKRARRNSSASTPWFGSVISSKKRPLIPPPPDLTRPHRSPGTYSASGTTIASDYGWQRSGGAATTAIAVGPGSSCIVPLPMTIADPFDCDLVLPEVMSLDANEDHYRLRHPRQLVVEGEDENYDDAEDFPPGKRWPIGGSGTNHDFMIGEGCDSGGPGGEVEVNHHGVRWASYRASPNVNIANDGGGASGAKGVPDVDELQQSPMTSFGTRWTGVRTLFYEVPPHCQS